jgi:hypothetical protein
MLSDIRIEAALFPTDHQRIGLEVLQPTARQNVGAFQPKAPANIQ